MTALLGSLMVMNPIYVGGAMTTRVDATKIRTTSLMADTIPNGV